MSRIYACISEEPDSLEHLNFASGRSFLLQVETELTHFVLLYADRQLSQCRPAPGVSLPWRVSPNTTSQNSVTKRPEDNSCFDSPTVVHQEGSPPYLSFAALPSRQRYLIHVAAARFQLDSESRGWWGVRSTVVRLTANSRIPVLKWEDFLATACLTTTQQDNGRGGEEGKGGGGELEEEEERKPKEGEELSRRRKKGRGFMETEGRLQSWGGDETKNQMKNGRDDVSEIEGTLRQLVLGQQSNGEPTSQQEAVVGCGGGGGAAAEEESNNASSDLEPSFVQRPSGCRNERSRQVNLYRSSAEVVAAERGGSSRRDGLRKELLHLRPEWRLPDSGFLLKFRVAYDLLLAQGSPPTCSLGAFRVFLYSDKQDVVQLLHSGPSAFGRSESTSEKKNRRLLSVEADSGCCCSGVVALEFTPTICDGSRNSVITPPRCCWEVAAYGCGPLEGGASSRETSEEIGATAAADAQQQTKHHHGGGGGGGGRVKRGRGSFRAGTDLFDKKNKAEPDGLDMSGGNAPSRYSSCKVADPFDFRTTFWIASYVERSSAGCFGEGLLGGRQERHVLVGMGQFPQWVIMHLRIPVEGGTWHVTRDEPTKQGLINSQSVAAAATCLQEEVDGRHCDEAALVQEEEGSSNRAFRSVKSATRQRHAYRFFGFGIPESGTSDESVPLCLRDISVGSDELVGRLPFAQREHIIEVRSSDGKAKGNPVALPSSWAFQDVLKWMKARLNSTDDIRAICGRASGLPTLPEGGSVLVSSQSGSTQPAEEGGACGGQQLSDQCKADVGPSEELILVVCNSSDSAQTVMADLVSQIESAAIHGQTSESSLCLGGGSLSSLGETQLLKNQTAARRPPHVGFYDNGEVHLSSLAPCKECSNYYRGNAYHSNLNVSPATTSQLLSDSMIRSGPWTSPSSGTPTSVQVSPDSWLICLSEVLNSFHQSTLLELGVRDLCSTLRKRFMIAASPPRCSADPLTVLAMSAAGNGAFASVGDSMAVHAPPVSSSEQGSLYSITATRGLCLSSGAQRMLRANLPARDKERLLRRQPQQGSAATS
eukprot:GHVS01072520.1.p1 GENE.GHVS01072520.1~~GHVS01072520.1.p1  ORF type:complete len:1050 (-),score=230.99 GHVS01072520.1:477-3626(-)